jgi:hypothetical protein
MVIQSLALCCSVSIGLNQFEREKNRTEPKLIGLNRFSIRIGSKTKKKKKNNLVVYFGSKPDQTENAQP